jgi:cell division protein FtsA
MRHYASIPFGGNNITGDIQLESEGSIGRELAENIKIAFGACMPEKIQNLSEKIIHIKSDNGEADKKLPVKYLSEIITARVEEILMAILYEIQQSGFADRLMSGIVVTGGCAQTANIGNLIYDLSGYRVRTGYPKQHFSNAGCDGLKDTTAATSIGLILAAKDELGVNCAYNDDQGGSSVIIENGDEDEVMEAPAGVQMEPAEIDPTPQPNGKLFSDDDIEVVEKPKKKQKSSIFATWRKAKQKMEEALDKLSEEQV